MPWPIAAVLAHLGGGGLYVGTSPDGKVYRVNADGSSIPLQLKDYAIQPLDHWTSPHTGTIYPAGWHVSVQSTAGPITLDKLAGEPIDLLVNGKYFAKGEVVVIDENFGVRITSILSPAERLAQLG